MLTMIIADDEAIVRRGLKNIIRWDTYGIEVAAEAVDGLEALELCQKLKPDILFTDIRMPLMDGLEVAMKLEEANLPTKVVFISGAQDFNYAKTALEIDAEGYVLKPVNVPKLQEVMAKVVHRIKMERNHQSEMLSLKRQLHEHLPVIRDNFLRNLIGGVYRDEQEIRQKLTYLNLPFQEKESLSVTVLQIDDYAVKTETMSEEEKQILNYSIANIVDEIMTNNQSGVSFFMNELEFIQLFNQKAILNRTISEICEEIRQCLKKFLKLSVSIGIGRPVSHFSQTRFSLNDARTALHYKFYTGKGSILDINDINIMHSLNTEHEHSAELYERESQLMTQIKLGNVDAMEEVLLNMFEVLFSGNGLAADYIQGLCVELICLTSRTVQDMGENLDGIAEKRSSLIETIYKIDSADELKRYMLTLFIRITDYFSQKYNQKNQRVVKQIKDIIHEKYGEDISVAKISQEVYLSPNYISMIFKQETGETITEYLTNFRMEQAKRLLRSTDLKILEVALKVGYEDPHYFSKAFKKVTGVQPQKYRYVQ